MQSVSQKKDKKEGRVYRESQLQTLVHINVQNPNQSSRTCWTSRSIFICRHLV